MLGEEKTVQVFHPLTDVETELTNLEVSYTSGHRKYTPIASGKTASLLFRAVTPHDGQVYCYFPSDWKREVALNLNGESYGTYFANETYRVVSLGQFAAKDEIILTMTLNDSNLYMRNGTNYFYYLDTALFEDVMARLSAGNMEITSSSDTAISGTVTATEDASVLFTSIPYDEGWMVYVDGERAQISKTLDALLAIELEPGTHTVTMRYMSQAVAVGLTVSFVGFGAFAICIAVALMKRRKNRKIKNV